MEYLSFIPRDWGISVKNLKVCRCYTSNWLLESCYLPYSLIKCLAFSRNLCKLFGPCWMISWMSWLIFCCSHTYSWKGWITKKSEPWAQTEAWPKWIPSQINQRFLQLGCPWGKEEWATHTQTSEFHWTESRGKFQGWGDPDTANQIILDWKGSEKLGDRKCHKNASS